MQLRSRVGMAVARPAATAPIRPLAQKILYTVGRAIKKKRGRKEEKESGERKKEKERGRERRKEEGGKEGRKPENRRMY